MVENYERRMFMRFEARLGSPELAKKAMKFWKPELMELYVGAFLEGGTSLGVDSEPLFEAIVKRLS